MPSFNQEIVFFLITSNLIVLGFAVFAFFIIRIQQKRKERFRRRLAEKEFTTRQQTIAAISRDLHDDVGSSLSGISLFTQMALAESGQKKTEAVDTLLHHINDYTQVVIERTGDLVWMMQPENDSEEKMFERLEAFSRKLAAAGEVKLLFSKAAGFSLPVQQLSYRRNIYLACKEAVNNALKYSGCTTLVIECRDRHIMIADDGSGFDPALVNSGHGLIHMQQRAAECSATLVIDSAPGKGTQVRFEW